MPNEWVHRPQRRIVSMTGFFMQCQNWAWPSLFKIQPSYQEQDWAISWIWFFQMTCFLFRYWITCLQSVLVTTISFNSQFIQITMMIIVPFHHLHACMIITTSVLILMVNQFNCQYIIGQPEIMIKAMIMTSIDWHELFGSNFDVESIWLKFTFLVWPIIDLYVPKKLISHDTKYNTRIYPKFIRNLLSRKAVIWRKLKHLNNPILKNKYNQIARECKIAIHKFDSVRESKLLDACNLGAFYKFVNNKLSSPSGIAPLFNSQGQLLTSDLDKSNLLNRYFESVFTLDNGIIPNFPNRLPSDTLGINDITISPTIVNRKLLLPAFNLTCLLTHCLLLFSLLTGSFILLKLLFSKFTMTSSLRWIVVRSLHSFFSTYLLPSILSIMPSFLLVFKIVSVLMVCLLIGSHLISHFALRQSQSMIPSLHSLLFPVVYPKVPYLAHSFSLSIQLLSARWSQKIPSNIICTLMTPSCTSLSHLQILLYLLKHLPPLTTYHLLT